MLEARRLENFNMVLVASVDHSTIFFMLSFEILVACSKLLACTWSSPGPCSLAVGLLQVAQDGPITTDDRVTHAMDVAEESGEAHLKRNDDCFFRLRF